MKRGIEFGELKIGDIARKHLMDVCDTNWASSGPKVALFEKKWGELFGYKHNKAVSSGTDADINACASMHCLGANRGDEIICPALAFVATSNSVLAAGFTPVFVDIERETLNINTALIEDKITPRTWAIMAVHTMGKPCDMKPIMEVARRHHLVVIEDSAEAHGAMYKGKFVGQWGDVATFSFYVAHLICCGEGGMVSTNRDDIAESVISTRSHGRRGGGTFFSHDDVGFNSKMNDLEASIGLEGVEHFWQTFIKRKENVEYLVNGCKDLEEFAWFNKQEDYEVCCPHAFSVTLRDSKFDYKCLYSYLEGKGIKCKRNFGSIPTQHKAYDFMGHNLGDFPEAEYVGGNGLHFGVHQYLSEDDLDYALEVMHTYFKEVC